VAHELGRTLGPLDDLEGAVLQQRVDQLQQKEGISRDLRHQLAAHGDDPFAHAEAGLDEADLLVGGEASQLDAHDAFEVGREALFRSRHEQEQDGHPLAPLQELADQLEARACPPIAGPSTTSTSGPARAMLPSKWRTPTTTRSRR
jgi:hypothetical protein